jgi:hypothetical protein
MGRVNQKDNDTAKQPFMFLSRCFLLRCWLESALPHRPDDVLWGLLLACVVFRSLLRSKQPGEWVTQLLRQGDAKVFKKYSQMKLQMKREALQKMNRQANEIDRSFDTERPN